MLCVGQPRQRGRGASLVILPHSKNHECSLILRTNRITGGKAKPHDNGRNQGEVKPIWKGAKSIHMVISSRHPKATVLTIWPQREECLRPGLRCCVWGGAD